MTREIDFSACERNMRVFNGANGAKIGVKFENENYMLKFAPPAKDGRESNACLSEHIGSRVMRSLGLEAQETLLGTYEGRLVVACKDFRGQKWQFTDFRGKLLAI